MTKPKGVFYGTERVLAQPMTRGDYNAYRGWTLPPDENGNDAGYLVERADVDRSNHARHAGYLSWSPADVFEQSHRPNNAMTFGHALEALKAGKRVARAGWNGKGMFLYLVPVNAYPAQTGAAKAYWGEDALVPYGAYIAMKTAQENVVPWLASQTDVLTEDWVELEG